MKAFRNPAVAKVFASYPEPLRARLLFLRELIYQTAAGMEEVGPLEEALKWGQPSYLTSQTGSGSTIRLDAIRGQPGRYAMYFHCQTTLVDTFRRRFGRTFRYEGNRALLFDTKQDLPIAELKECVALALTYHRHGAPARIPIRHRIR